MDREQIVNEIESLVKILKATGGWVKKESGEGWFNHEILSDALALIRELTEENERLETICDMKQCVIENAEADIAKAKADTVRKMRERLEERINQTIRVFDF